MLRHQNLLRISSVLFMVQSFAWFLFSFLCILCIEGAITQGTLVDDSYNLYLQNTIYLLYFTKDVDYSNSDWVVTPRVFEGFAFIHLFLAISWFILSLTVLQRSSNRRIQNLQKSPILQSWLINGYLVAFIDGIFTILFIIDMIETTRKYNLMVSLQVMPAISLVFIIVSRGFTLWILNITFIVKLTRGMWLGPKMYRQDGVDMRYGNQYDGSAYVNNGYQSSNPPIQQNHYIYPPATQQHAGQRMPNDDDLPYRQAEGRYLTNSPGYPSAAPTSPYAQINRNPSPPGRQSPLARLHAVPPPQIPEPDYQRGPRTVLKNRSQYDSRY